MRPYFFIIIFTFSTLRVFSQNADAKSNSLGGCSLTQTNIFSNFSNQAGIADITQTTIGLGVLNKFGIKELNTYNAAFALPINGGVLGLNVSYTGFELYNRNKIGFAFGKKLSNSFNIGIQVDYIGIHQENNTLNSNQFTFEIGIQKILSKKITLGSHIFNPISVKLNNDENIPSIFKLGMLYKANKKVDLFTETEFENNEKAILKVGLEYRIINQLQLRTGFSSNPSKNSFGIGYSIGDIQLDTSINHHQFLGYSPQFSVSSSF